MAGDTWFFLRIFLLLVLLSAHIKRFSVSSMQIFVLLFRLVFALSAKNGLCKGVELARERVCCQPGSLSSFFFADLWRLYKNLGDHLNDWLRRTFVKNLWNTISITHKRFKLGPCPFIIRVTLEWYIKYKEEKCFSYFLRTQGTNRSLITIIALLQSFQATVVSRPLSGHCMFRI